MLLCARSIRSQGAIEAKEGSVHIGSGTEFLYQPNGAQRLFIRASAPPQDTTTLCISGTIQAAEIELLSSNPRSKAIQVDGLIDATEVVLQNGRVLICSDGDTEIGGEILSPGGEIVVLGERAILNTGALLDVSAEGNGGSVFVGQAPEKTKLASAAVAYVDEGAKISVSSRVCGNGGKAIVWGDMAAVFKGVIEGRGGALGGNGGFAEVSARNVHTPGIVDLMAPMGQTGTFLIDPEDITIGIGGTSGSWGPCMAHPPDGNVYEEYMESVGANQILVSDLETQLGSCNVSISGNNITIAQGVTWHSNNTWIMVAEGSIQQAAATSFTISNDYSSGNFDAINWTANGNTVADGVIFFNTIHISTVDGNIQLTAQAGTPANVARGFFALGTTIEATGSGAITLNGTGGNYSTPAISGRGVQISPTSTLTTSSGNLSITGMGGSSPGVSNDGIYLESAGSFTSDSGNIVLNGIGGDSGDGVYLGNFLISNSGSISLTGVGGAADNAYGIDCNTHLSTLSGSLTFHGTGGSGASGNIGVSFGSGFGINSGDMTITGIGTGSGAGTGNSGILVQSLLNGSKNVNVTGTGGAGDSSPGIYLNGGSISNSGTSPPYSMTVIGTGGTGNSSCRGILMDEGADFTSSGETMTITAIGGGSDSGTDNEGILISDFSTIGGTSTKLVTINGTASHGTANQTGVRLTTSGSLSMTSNVVSALGLTVQGTANTKSASSPNTNLGISIEAGCTVTSRRGPLTMTAILNSNDDVAFANVATGTSAQIGASNSNAPITLIANQMSIGGSIQTLSTITIKPFDSATTIGIGTGATGILSWPATALQYLSSPYVTATISSVTFGSTAQTGAIDIQAYSGFTYPVSFISGGTNGSVVLEGAISTTAASKPITFQANGTGGLISLNSSATTHGSAITCTGPVLLPGASAVQFDATNSGGSPAGANISFSSTINGDNALVIDSGTGGVILFSDFIGDSVPLDSLTLSGKEADFTADCTTQGSTLTFNLPVVLLANVTYTDTGTTGITFNSTITGPYALDLEAPNGAITVVGTVNVASLTSSCSNAATFESPITTSGAVSITSTGNSVSVDAISAGNNIALQPASTYTSDVLSAGDNIPDGILILNGAINAAAHTVTLSPTGRSILLSVATITGPPSGGNLTITADTITIGSNETLTVRGNLALNAATLTLSDTIASGALTSSAATINIYLHNPGLIYTAAGDLITSPNTSILSSSVPALTGAIITSGPGAPEQIAAVPLSPSAFSALLIYSGYLLDFVEAATPPPSTAAREQLEFKAALAIEEMLIMRLPICWNPTYTSRNYDCKFDCCQPHNCCLGPEGHLRYPKKAS